MQKNDAKLCPGCKKQTLELVGSISSSPPEPWEHCPGCQTDVVEGDVLHVSITEYKQRRAIVYRPGKVTVNKRGRELGLGKHAGTFGTVKK